MSHRPKNFFMLAGAVLVGVLLLAGCTSNGVYSDKCQAIQLRYRLAESLEGRGIQVAAVGDEVTLILPSEKFFYAGSNHLSTYSDSSEVLPSTYYRFNPVSDKNRLNSSSILDLIVEFLNAYPTEDIQVKGYTSNVGDYKRNLALSRDRAEQIENYLVRHGLNTRLISASGYGCHNIYDFDHIEIFFRQSPPDNIFH